MKKLAVFLLLLPLLFPVTFKDMKCVVIHPGDSRTLPGGAPCVVIDGSNDQIYWVKITTLPYNTGMPELDQDLNAHTRPLDYVGCKTYKELSSAETCILCEEEFVDYEIRTGETVWYLVVGSHSSDFCYFDGGGPLRVETKRVGTQDDAGSKRDAYKYDPVEVEVNKVYSGLSAGDKDWYTVKLPRGKLIEFSITYKDGPPHSYPLYYALIKENKARPFYYPELYGYCTASGKLVWGNWRDGSTIWNSGFFPGVGETARCYFKYEKISHPGPESQTATLHFFVDTPLQHPRGAGGGTPREDFRVPTYTFSFRVVEDEGERK